jgi:hypothetical protein
VAVIIDLGMCVCLSRFVVVDKTCDNN